MKTYIICLGIILVLGSCTQNGDAVNNNGKPAEPEITVCKG